MKHHPQENSAVDSDQNIGTGCREDAARFAARRRRRFRNIGTLGIDRRKEFAFLLRGR
jgi:hypothetical protein